MSSSKMSKDEQMDRFGKNLNFFEMCLLRPDTFIGSIKTVKGNHWIFNEEQGIIERRKINYNQGLIRIFIEIMSNAIDNKWRSEKKGIKMTKIEFTIDKETGWITCWNDGLGIPVIKHKYKISDQMTDETKIIKMYPAEMFFGSGFSGTNYKDEEDRKTSGRNGVGAKATNAFSDHFIIEHYDSETGQVLKKEYKKNGTERLATEISSMKRKNSWTQVSFLPDYERFGYSGIDDDFFDLIKTYIYECAMITKFNVFLNGEKIIVKDLLKYAKLYFPDSKTNPCIYFTAPNGDECVLVQNISDNDDRDDVDHISFINGIHTLRGGAHVSVWKKLIFSNIVLSFNKRNPKKGQKKTELKKTTAKQLFPYFTLFVRCEAFNPQFDTQTKDFMTSPDIDLEVTTEFKQEIDSAIIKILRWSFVKDLEEKLKFKQKKTTVPRTVERDVSYGKKLWDANEAGKRKRTQCTLFITEGLSPKNWADTFISKLEGGHDLNGSCAIRGKFIGENKTELQIWGNEEVQMLTRVLGLVQNVDYSDDSNYKTLRYGKICILTDADDDGIHIRGLLLNFFFRYWPSLFERNVISAFSTSIVKATHKRNRTKTKVFYTKTEFEQWTSENEKLAKQYDIKYFKGLGSHQPGDENFYIKDPKCVIFIPDEKVDTFLKLAFNKQYSNQRKEWIVKDIPKPLSETSEKMIIKKKKKHMTYDGDLPMSNFISNDLVVFFRTSVTRAMPNMYDSFNESYRKIFYCVGPKDIKVNVLMGDITSRTDYQHGPASLEGAIVKMAQGFVGSNNIPLLVNSGEFGSRMTCANDTAGRYLYTHLDPISNYLYRKEDEPLLIHEISDGIVVEYKHYVPILPTLLINGKTGIATGYSTQIMCYNPEDLIEWIEKWLEDENNYVEDEETKLLPWCRGFKGKFEFVKKNGKITGWKSTGILKEKKDGWWEISEVPVNVSFNDVKEYLELLRDGKSPKKKGEKGKAKKKTEKDKKPKQKLIQSFVQNGSPNSAVFKFKPIEGFEPDINTNFSILISRGSFTNMVMLDENNYPRKYNKVESMLNDFCKYRLDFYDKRKIYWLGIWKQELVIKQNRYIFIQKVRDGELDIHQEDENLISSMEEFEFEKVDDSYNYLLDMPIRSITVKKMENMAKEIKELKEKIKKYKSQTNKDLWKSDLQDFKEYYPKFLKLREIDFS